MILYDVHTTGSPVRHYQQYPDPVLAQRMAGHLSAVLGVPLVVEAIEEPATQSTEVTVYRLLATRRRWRRTTTVVVGRADPDQLEAAMSVWAQQMPGWALRAIPETFSGPATTETPADAARGVMR